LPWEVFLKKFFGDIVLVQSLHPGTPKQTAQLTALVCKSFECDNPIAMLVEIWHRRTIIVRINEVPICVACGIGLLRCGLAEELPNVEFLT
jgi:hypothetical protein